MEYDNMSEKGKKILLFGGTEFMGRSLVSHFNSLHSNWEITLLNRGNMYWNQELPFQVNRIYCDRQDRSLFLSVLDQLAKEEWDLVIDFSAFEREDVEMLVEKMKNKIKHYIFISSDSVYMVCAPPSSPRPFGRSEVDSIRPSSKEERDNLNEKDSYGNGKLECEEYLLESFKQYSFPCTSLRLPDVFGPFDTTDRHWRYQLWLTVSEQFPLQLSEESKTKRLGFVFSEDVVSAIITVFQNGEKTFGQSYNVACQETPTLEQYLSQVSYFLSQQSSSLSTSNLKPIPVDRNRSEESDESSSSSDSDSTFSLDSEFLPSVDFGHIDTTKISTQLNWKPTPIQQSLQKTVSFFERAFYEYPNLVPLSAFDSMMREAIQKRYQDLIKK
eukprot:TRINITY_DN4868_c0_g1_i1.p2 TRINITY_DN4868_c0_g1~~TRINITY_DN4868_c0_g1_i1.p2  ORF type:complete len:385 (-),score=127.53 TRINITY_DN4868_c0_g1_i1:8-1162(-)